MSLSGGSLRKESIFNTRELLKETFADLINFFDRIRDETEEQDVKRLASITISKLEEACMFGIKTLTYNK